MHECPRVNGTGSISFGSAANMQYGMHVGLSHLRNRPHKRLSGWRESLGDTAEY